MYSRWSLANDLNSSKEMRPGCSERKKEMRKKERKKRGRNGREMNYICFCKRKDIVNERLLIDLYRTESTSCQKCQNRQKMNLAYSLLFVFIYRMRQVTDGNFLLRLRFLLLERPTKTRLQKKRK
jgi:hypothetical protein